MMKTNALALLLLAALTFTACQNDNNTTENADTDASETMVAADGAEGAENAANEAAENTAPEIPLTSVEWTKKVHDFGDIPRGEKQKHTFTFKNAGDNPLVISSATAGCGCTVPKKPEEPIAPGETGELEVEYNGSGSGRISKNVTVLLNTESGKDILNITANVLTEEASAE